MSGTQTPARQSREARYRAQRRVDRFMAWGRLVVGVIAATALAVLIAGYQTRDNTIAGCIRNGESKVIDARYFAKTGNIDLSDQKRATIPMPHGWHGDASTRGDKAADRAEGCRDAFPPPIPWIE